MSASCRRRFVDFVVGYPDDHLLGQRCALGFPRVLFYFMPSWSFVFRSRMVSVERSGIRLYRFLIIAFSSTFNNRYMYKILLSYCTYRMSECVYCEISILSKNRNVTYILPKIKALKYFFKHCDVFLSLGRHQKTTCTKLFSDFLSYRGFIELVLKTSQTVKTAQGACASAEFFTLS